MTNPDAATEWRELNLAWWDERAPLHATLVRSGRYGGGLGAFEWNEIGSVENLRVAHLQCHVGTDTIALAEAGARVVGLDFSAPALRAAQDLAREADVESRCLWVRSDVYNAATALGRHRFDLVYTGKGALCWIPDLDEWAAVVHDLLKPGGRLYLAEMHPFQDLMGDDDTAIERGYFPSGGEVYDASGSYADPDAATSANNAVDFVHPLSEVVSALLEGGFTLRMLHEHPFTVYRRWPWLERDDDGIYRQPDARPTLPLLYSLVATADAPG